MNNETRAFITSIIEDEGLPRYIKAGAKKLLKEEQEKERKEQKEVFLEKIGNFILIAALCLLLYAGYLFYIH